MKNILITCALLSLLCLSGCGIGGGGDGSRTFMASFSYENMSEEQGWEIAAPTGNTRRLGIYYKSLMPEYFAGEQSIEGFADFNYLFAKYKYSNNETLALWIILSGGYEEQRMKKIRGFSSTIEILQRRNVEWCSHWDILSVLLMTNVVDVDFNTKEVFMEKDTMHIQPKLVSLQVQGYLVNPQYFELTSYNLADPKVIANLQYSRTPKGLSYPAFGFLFSPITCRSVDNTILVIDGFSYKGQDIPPLKIHIKYAADYNIPAYIGPADYEPDPYELIGEESSRFKLW